MKMSCSIHACDNQALFKIAGTNIPKYCRLHLPFKNNARRQVCIQLNCQAKPRYGFVKKRPIYCCRHKPINHINVRT